MTSMLYLFEALPAAGSQRRSEVSEAQHLSLTGCCRQTEGKTLFAPSAPFWLFLKTANVLQPLLMVVVSVNPSYAKTLCMALALLFTDLILLTWPDVWIVIEYGRAHAIGKHPLYNGRRTWGTAGMQQHLPTSLRHYNRRFLQCSMLNAQCSMLNVQCSKPPVLPDAVLRGIDLLELLLRRPAHILPEGSHLVGMVLQGELAIGLLHLIV